MAQGWQKKCLPSQKMELITAFVMEDETAQMQVHVSAARDAHGSCYTFKVMQ